MKQLTMVKVAGVVCSLAAFGGGLAKAEILSIDTNGVITQVPTSQGDYDGVDLALQSELDAQVSEIDGSFDEVSDELDAINEDLTEIGNLYVEGVEASELGYNIYYDQGDNPWIFEETSPGKWSINLGGDPEFGWWTDQPDSTVEIYVNDFNLPNFQYGVEYEPTIENSGALGYLENEVNALKEVTSSIESDSAAIQTNKDNIKKKVDQTEFDEVIGNVSVEGTPGTPAVEFVPTFYEYEKNNGDIWQFTENPYGTFNATVTNNGVVIEDALNNAFDPWTPNEIASYIINSINDTYTLTETIEGTAAVDAIEAIDPIEGAGILGDIEALENSIESIEAGLVVEYDDTALDTAIKANTTAITENAETSFMADVALQEAIDENIETLSNHWTSITANAESNTADAALISANITAIKANADRNLEQDPLINKNTAARILHANQIQAAKDKINVNVTNISNNKNKLATTYDIATTNFNAIGDGPATTKLEYIVDLPGGGYDQYLEKEIGSGTYNRAEYNKNGTPILLYSTTYYTADVEALDATVSGGSTTVWDGINANAEAIANIEVGEAPDLTQIKADIKTNYNIGQTNTFNITTEYAKNGINHATLNGAGSNGSFLINDYESANIGTLSEPAKELIKSENGLIGEVIENSISIEDHAADIATNKSDITTAGNANKLQDAQIGQNEESIEENYNERLANSGRIGALETTDATHTADITTINDKLVDIEGGILANSNAIVLSNGNISTNTADIANNTTSIDNTSSSLLINIVDTTVNTEELAEIDEILNGEITQAFVPGNLTTTQSNAEGDHRWEFIEVSDDVWSRTRYTTVDGVEVTKEYSNIDNTDLQKIIDGAFGHSVQGGLYFGNPEIRADGLLANVEDNAGSIATNTSAIATNYGYIQDNAADIEALQGVDSDNDHRLKNCRTRNLRLNELNVCWW